MHGEQINILAIRCMTEWLCRGGVGGIVGGALQGDALPGFRPKSVQYDIEISKPNAVLPVLLLMVRLALVFFFQHGIVCYFAVRATSRGRLAVRAHHQHGIVVCNAMKATKRKL